MAKETPAQKRKVKKVMHEFKEGKLKSGAGKKRPKVKSRRQAVAIALSEAKVPPKPGTTRAKQAAKKKTTIRKTPTKRSVAKKTTRRTTAKKAPTRTVRKSPVRKRAGTKRAPRKSSR